MSADSGEDTRSAATRPADRERGAKPVALQVLSPHATAEEIAALVTVLTAAGESVAEPEQRSAWVNRGRSGWRRSGLPAD